MNDEMKASDLLRAAARLVERSILKLNTRQSQCAGCGKTVFNNPNHGKVYERITDTPEKLRAAADKIDGLDDLGIAPRKSGDRM